MTDKLSLQILPAGTMAVMRINIRNFLAFALIDSEKVR